MKKILLLSSLLFALACNPLKHYQKVAADTYRSIPEITLLAPVCAEEFPVRESRDTVIMVDEVMVKDTASENSLKDKIAQLLNSETDPAIITDTLYKTIKKYYKPEVITRTKYTTVTAVKVDSALVKTWQDKAYKASEQLASETARANKNGTRALWLGILLLLSAVVQVGYVFIRSRFKI